MPSTEPRESRIARLTAPRVLGLFGSCCLVLGLLSFGVHYARHRTLVWNDDVVAGRDFLAFYAAGRIVGEGDGSRLYDLAFQERVQAEILAPETLGGFLPFVNPVPLALAYAPLARLPYRTAFAVHVLAMLACYLAGIAWLLPRLAALSRHPWVIVTLGLSWLPMLMNVLGGQNAALSFALLCGAYAATASGRPRRAGLALGLLLFKPQYALPFVGLLLLRRRFVTSGVFGLVALTGYALGAAVSGASWPLGMLALTTGPFRELERVANGSKHIALAEVLDYSLVLPLEHTAAAAWVEPLVAGATLGLGLAGVLLLVWIWRRADPRRADFGLRWALVVPVMLLISPHTQSYEIALLLLPALLVLDHQLAHGPPVSDLLRHALVAGYFVFPLWRLVDVLHVQPLIGVPVLAAAWALAVLRWERPGRVAHPLAPERGWEAG